jgi:hypothetical protein
MTSRAAIFTSEFPPYPGGIATYTFEIASAVRKLGIDPVVFAPKMPAHEQVPTEYEVIYCTPSYYRHYHAAQSYVDAARRLRRRTYDFVVAGAPALPPPEMSRHRFKTMEAPLQLVG